MSEYETPTQPTDIVEAGSQVLNGPESLKEGLRRQRDEASEMKSLELPLPEYRNPQLVAKYRLVEPAELAKVGDRIRNEFKTLADRAIYGAIDSLIFSCEGLYGKYADSDELIPLDPDVPMIFDTRLAEFLDIPASSARETVRAVFGYNDYAIIEHNIKIGRWMGDRTTDLSSGLGEM